MASVLVSSEVSHTHLFTIVSNTKWSLSNKRNMQTTQKKVPFLLFSIDKKWAEIEL